MSGFMFNLAMKSLQSEKRKLQHVRKFLKERDTYRQDFIDYLTDQISDIDERIKRLREEKKGLID